MKKRHCLQTTLLILLFFLIKNSLFASSPDKNYEFSIIRRINTLAIYPQDLNDDGDDELILFHGEQVDVRDIKNFYHLKSFVISLDRNYSYTPLKSSKLDSLCFLVSYNTKDSVVYHLLIKTPEKDILVEGWFVNCCPSCRCFITIC